VEGNISVKNKTISACALLLLLVYSLAPVDSVAESDLFNRPLDSVYFDAQGNFDRNRYFRDLDSIAFETSLSLKTTGSTLDCIVNPFREPDTLWDIGWDRFNQDPAMANARRYIIYSGFRESVVDTITYVPDHFVCHDFTLATQIEFSGFLRYLDQHSTAHAEYDTIVTPNRFNIPCYYVSVSAPDFAHAITGFMVGNDVSNFDDWHFVEPQDDDVAWVGTFSIPSNVSVINIGQPVYHYADYDMIRVIWLVTFVFQNGQPDSCWINPYESVITSRPSETDVLPFLYLEQNYPNPFNASTTITYNLPISGRVSLKIYNILGQCVETIIDDIQPAGAYAREIDMSDKASGVYLYHFKANGESICRKMVLVR
jgi:hypothetical protein